ncbi:MAG: carboxylate-amine ligase, partial [Solirubrobacteraceae bacterium]
MTDAIGRARFGEQADFALGVEEELLLVDPGSRALSHTGVDVLARMDEIGLDGFAHPDTYSALVELASPVVRDAGEGVAALSALRARVRAAGGTAIGAGIHPDGAFGDVEHVDEPRYDRIIDQVQGLIKRTPTCALHVHVGMPDAATAVRVFNGLREQLPLLQALAANSPFWHGRDSGLATARAQLFRGYPRAEIPRAFASYDDYAATVQGVVDAGDLPDYTFLWWDIRPHPRLGTVEVRAMDSQSALWSAAGLSALVHGLARADAQEVRHAW